MAKQEDNISRRQFMTGAGAVGAGALVVGGVGGGLIGHSTASDKKSSAAASSVAAKSGKPYLIGSPYPTTGPYAADGDQMRNGSQLAIDEINAAGGIAGRPIKRVIVDCKIDSPEGVTAALNNLVSQKVDAIVGGYVQVDAPAYDIVPPYGAPYLHGNTLQSGVARVIKDPKKYHMIFNVDPTEVWYGKGFPDFLAFLDQSGKFKLPSKTFTAIQGDIVYSETIAGAANDAMKSAGWSTYPVQKVVTPVSEWGPVIRALHSKTPGVVFNAHPAPADQAAFMKQFAANPTNSLVYLQYGPSIPQFLKLAGSSANGVVWSTVVGNLGDSKGQDFNKKYQAKHNEPPGHDQAPQGYDTIYLLAQAWAQVGDARNFPAVCDAIRRTSYRGVCGTYNMNHPGQFTLPYPEATKDPSLGMAHQVLQVQNGQHKIIYPPLYAEAEFQLPPWMKA
jgi:branched-chain amino acid transport system substrate-binding protein